VKSFDGLRDITDRKWIYACTVSDLPEDEGLQLKTVPSTAVFAAEGEYFCIDDTCTHETYSLADGWVEGCVVECALHMAKFDLRNGEVLSPPATVPVAVHPTARIGDEIFVALPSKYVVMGG